MNYFSTIPLQARIDSSSLHSRVLLASEIAHGRHEAFATGGGIFYSTFTFAVELVGKLLLQSDFCT